MTIFFHDMDLQERVALTLAMRYSGHTLDWRREALGGPVVDKHPTGGVGDVTQLMLWSMIVACGGFVLMFSGRGLWHTGGTLDKLEAIPRLAIFLDDDAFRSQIKQVVVAIMVQTHSLAPANKRIYATSDITGTVDWDSGALMAILAGSKALAQAIVGIANGA